MKECVDLIFELFHLKHVKHEGRRLAGVEQPSSVAEHSLNAAQIGTVLALMEGVDANKVTTMLVWHDSAETRIGDIHKIAIRYLKDKKEVERSVSDDQLSDKKFATIHELMNEIYDKSSPEAIVAKDADYLEMAFQAKVYLEQGYTKAENWIKNVGNALQTDSAKALWEEMRTAASTDRWEDKKLKKLS